MQQLVRPENARYAAWISSHRNSPEVLLERLKALPEAPLFIFIIWDMAGIFRELESSIESLEKQPYTAIKILVSTSQPLEQAVSHRKNIEYMMPDRLADALGSTRGEYLAFLSAGDRVASHALVNLAETVNAKNRPDLVYSDEDTIKKSGKRSDPVFKPDWSPDLLLTQYYLGNLTIFRMAAVEACGGIKWQLGEAAAHDLALRITEKSERVAHIPDVLCYKPARKTRVVKSDATIGILNQAIERRKLPVEVTEDERYPGLFIPHWFPEGNPQVSMIILNKDRPEYLDVCLKSIFSLTDYPNYDVLIVDNGSVSRITHDLYAQWQVRERDRFHVIEIDEPFNFSRLNNRAASLDKGKLLLFLNNDTRVLSPNWLAEMAGQAIRPQVGAVGCLLQYPNRTVQHAGIIISEPLIALHTHYHFPVISRGHLGRLRVPAECSMVTGACMMIRKQLFQKLGGFDDHLKIAYNDADLCLRARKAGYRNLILAQVRLVHLESITRGRESSRDARSRLEMEKEYFLSRWGPLGADPYYNLNFDQSRGDYSLPV